KWQKITDDLKSTLYELEHSNNDLALTKKHWQDAKQKAGLIQIEKESKSNEQAVKKKEYKDANEKLAEYRQTANEGLIDSVRELLVKRVGVVVDEQLAFISSFENKIQQKINALHDKASGRKERATNEATGIMGAFRQRWEIIAGEWSASIQSLTDYLDHLQTLQEEGLPALVEQFKERLNRHTTQSIATIKSRIEAEREDITERIEIINKVLKRTEFRPGSHLKLGSKPEQFPHVKEFNLKVSRVLSQATSDDHELRFASLQEVVEILDRASAPATVNNMESLRLLDPRHQLSFHAEEIETETLRVLDVLESSSGKSGGEKESFAGTIVAASLAYVLTPEDYDQPVYCTVFLDEAFSNTAEAVSRRVLRVFRELNIHVNLITPYKNLNLARESAKSLIIAERDQVRHESRLCEVSWEEIDRRHEEQKQKKLVDEAESLGIVINE
ncbi:MAG: SbcC/MukB-like Walker B domain-containing protein, partial [Methylococcales bacterium]